MTDDHLYAKVPARRALGLSLRIAWCADKWRTLIVLTAGSGKSVAFGLESLGLERLVDAVVRGDLSATVEAVVLIAVLHLAGLLGDWQGFMASMRLREAIVLETDRRVIELTASPPDVDHLERPDYADELHLLQAERERFALMIDSLSSSIAVIVAILTTIALLITVDPLLALLPLFGIATLFTGARAAKASQRAADATAEPARVRDFTFALATSANAGKELRVFGLRSEVKQRFHARATEVRTLSTHGNLLALAWTALGWLVFIGAYGVAIGLVAVRVVHHEASPGELVLVLTLAAQVNEQVEEVVSSVQWLMHSLRNGRRLVWFEDYALERRRAMEPTEQAVAPPDRLANGITLEHLSFGYPRTRHLVLTDVNVHLPAGSIVAVVGDNGVGKTTLVKLLLRLYEPSTGRLLIDRTDLRKIPVEEWRKRVSGAFQDYMRYEVVAGEAVGIGDLPHMSDTPRITAALERSDATGAVESLPAGLATQLGKSFDGGVDLSGGQWQKLALARAMMRPAPLLQVFDEPTASLDAESERTLFERFARSGRAAAAESGSITVIVSHRFSTVRMADLILVVDDGRVVEAGSHDELIARDGAYAQLFFLQAAAYS
jgi:ATP-binding cassette subfamily B protein